MTSLTQNYVCPDYESIEDDFYYKQTKSLNPLRKWFHLNRYKISNSLVKSHYKKGHKIIDLGCGSCDWNTEHLNVFGIDSNEGFLKRAKLQDRLSDYKVASASDTGLPSESFDIVTAFEFLEHVHDYEKVIAEAKRLLKKGGHFIVSVPYDITFSMWKPLFFLQVVLQGYIFGNPYYKSRCGHVNHFSPEHLKKVFIAHGFDISVQFDMRKFTIFLCAQKPTEDTETEDSYSDVTIILPTLNEQHNINSAVVHLAKNYKNCRIIIADDGSTDKTEEMALKANYEHLTFLNRVNEPIHGLTASVLDAIKLVKTKYFLVMDADGQHPYEKADELVNILRQNNSLVIASRIEVEKKWPFARKALSYMGTMFAKTTLLLGGKKNLSYDVMGGFFGCDVDTWSRSIRGSSEEDIFRLEGYKILFDFLRYAPRDLRIEEVYYKFATRRADISKINPRVYMEFIKSCILPQGRRRTNEGLLHSRLRTNVTVTSSSGLTKSSVTAGSLSASNP